MRTRRGCSASEVLAKVPLFLCVVSVLVLAACGGGSSSPSEPINCRVVFGGSEPQFLRVINQASSSINVGFHFPPTYLNFDSEIKPGECALHGLPVPGPYHIEITRLPSGPTIVKTFLLGAGQTQTLTLTNDDF
jgi:hypothetical protein